MRGAYARERTFPLAEDSCAEIDKSRDEATVSDGGLAQRSLAHARVLPWLAREPGDDARELDGKRKPALASKLRRRAVQLRSARRKELVSHGSPILRRERPAEKQPDVPCNRAVARVVPVEHDDGPVAGVEEDVVEVQIAVDQRLRGGSQLGDDARELRAQCVDELYRRRREICLVPLKEGVSLGVEPLLTRKRLTSPAREALPTPAVPGVEAGDALENGLRLLDGAAGERIALPSAHVLEQEHPVHHSQETRRERRTDLTVELLLASGELDARTPLGDQSACAPVLVAERPAQHLAGEAEVRADAFPLDEGDRSGERLGQLRGSQPAAARRSGGASAWQIATASASAA
jgi:hypothetical protein